MSRGYLGGGWSGDSVAYQAQSSDRYERPDPGARSTATPNTDSLVLVHGVRPMEEGKNRVSRSPIGRGQPAGHLWSCGTIRYRP